VLALAWIAQASSGLAESADSLYAHLPSRIPFVQFMDSWRDFYVLAGTASVTLAGLLFIALALHLEQMVEPSHEHLLALSRAMLMSCIVVLMGSLMQLAPAFSRRISGFMLVAIGMAGTVFTLKIMANVKHHEEGGFSKSKMRRRKFLPLMGYFFMIGSGVGVALGIAELMYWVLPAFTTLLGNAAGTSFELLVHVARHKKQMKDARDA
jgi:hypothetical protein